MLVADDDGDDDCNDAVYDVYHHADNASVYRGMFCQYFSFLV